MLAGMAFSWDESRRAFSDAAQWFLATTALVGDRWDRPGLGEWDVRALVGHTSRSLLTVEAYLARPAYEVDVASVTGYYHATRTIAAGPEVAERGGAAGAALGTDPEAVVAATVARVLPVVEVLRGTELLTTIVGGMRLSDYLPTRTFELAVHTADLAAALDVPPDLPASAAGQALRIAGELALDGGHAAPLLLAVT